MILYDGRLKERTREQRKSWNLAEAMMWQKLQKKQFLGLPFTRQKPIGYYYADLYCHQAKVVIEIDGVSHNNTKEYDAERDEYMQGLGLTVIRISDIDIKMNINKVIEWLKTQYPFNQL